MRLCDSRKDVQDNDNVILIVSLWNVWEGKYLEGILIDFKIYMMKL